MPLKIVNYEDTTMHNRLLEEVDFGEKLGMTNILPSHVHQLLKYAIVGQFHAKVPNWVPFTQVFQYLGRM